MQITVIPHRWQLYSSVVCFSVFIVIQEKYLKKKQQMANYSIHMNIRWSWCVWCVIPSSTGKALEVGIVGLTTINTHSEVCDSDGI